MEETGAEEENHKGRGTRYAPTRSQIRRHEHNRWTRLPSRPAATSHPSARVEGSRRGTWPNVPTTRMDPAVRKVSEGCTPAGRIDPVKGRVLEVGVAVKQHRGAQGSSQCTYPWSRVGKQRETGRGTSAYVTCHTARREMAEAHG